MFTAAGAFISGIVTSAQGSLALPIVAVGLLIGGAVWAVGDHAKGRTAVTAALIGGAVMLLAATIATGMGSLPHA